MRTLLLALVVLAAVAGSAPADKPPIAQSPPPRTSCDLMIITYDWDFATSPHGFQPVDCDQGGASAWEYGETGNIPDPPPRVWGTVLESDYPNDAGAGLISPSFVVGPLSYLVEVTHYYVTEPGYDGANVSVGVWPASQVIEPDGGYPSIISENPGYYAHCVDSEPGWSGASDGWRVDCFDLSEYMGQEITLEFDFGADNSITDVGWYLAAVRVGNTAPIERACCFPLTGECQIIHEPGCLEQGGQWNPEWEACEPNPCPQPAFPPMLQVESWYNAEPWHDYIPLVPGEPLRINLDLPPGAIPPEEITSVEFFYSPDQGANWELMGVDVDGYQPSLSTIDSPAEPRGNGWGLVSALPLPLPEPGLPGVFRADVYRVQGPPLQFLMERVLDPAPPELVTLNVEDWKIVEQDTLMLRLHENGADVEVITVYFCPKLEEFIKGAPGYDQRIHSDWHCVPTATAQCLKFFEQTLGDVVITGGLNSFDLINALAVPMATNVYELGTRIGDWKAGLAQWIQTHGAGYTLRSNLYFEEDGTIVWEPLDWALMRNELERGMDVLVGVWWYDGGGHAMTLEAVVNTPLPNGRIRVGFKDPWTAQTEWGELDLATGWIYNLTGAGAGGLAFLGMTLVVSPAEAEPVSVESPCVLAYQGPLPPGQNAIPITVPVFAGDAFMHVVVQTEAQHARLLSRIVTREGSAVPGAEPLRAETFFLAAAAPNPFCEATSLSYGGPGAAHATLAVFDVTGRHVRILVDGAMAAGSHRATWDGRDDQGRPVDAGIYYARLVVEGHQEAQRVIVLR